MNTRRSSSASLLEREWQFLFHEIVCVSKHCRTLQHFLSAINAISHTQNSNVIKIKMEYCKCSSKSCMHACPCIHNFNRHTQFFHLDLDINVLLERQRHTNRQCEGRIKTEEEPALMWSQSMKREIQQSPSTIYIGLNKQQQRGRKETCKHRADYLFILNYFHICIQSTNKNPEKKRPKQNYLLDGFGECSKSVCFDVSTHTQFLCQFQCDDEYVKRKRLSKLREQHIQTVYQRLSQLQFV